MTAAIAAAVAIAMIDVDSSQIAKIGFDPNSRKMRIQFAARKDGTEGSTYEYENVSAEDHFALVNADSIGSHFGKHIKPFADKFPFHKCTAEELATA